MYMFNLRGRVYSSCAAGRKEHAYPEVMALIKLRRESAAKMDIANRQPRPGKAPLSQG